MANTRITPPSFYNESFSNHDIYALNEAIRYAIGAFYDIEALIFAIREATTKGDSYRLAHVTLSVVQDRFATLSTMVENAGGAK